MKNFLPLVLLLSLFADSNGAVAAQPNIVVVLADDLGWSDLGCYGGEIPTPNLDALASGGLRFRQFYNNSVCGPSRAALLTGLYPQRIGHSGTNWNQPTDFSRSVTLGEVLQNAGYHTMMVGKWQDPDLPARRGFHRFYGPMCSGKISYFHEVQANPFYRDETQVALPKDFYLTDALTENALAFLADAQAHSSDKPFFLYVAHVAPHWPLHAREAEIASHRPGYLRSGWNECRELRILRQKSTGLIAEAFVPAPFPKEIHSWNDDDHQAWQAERMAVYAAQVASVDRSTGRIIDALRSAGKLDDTLVLFLSDNGAAPDGGLKPTDRMLGFRPNVEINRTFRRDGVAIRPGSGPQLMPGPADTFAAYGLAWALTSTAPFRGTKLTGYEGGIRTPLIAHWPRGIQGRGRIVDEVGHVMDFMPTFIELADASYPPTLAGRRPLALDGMSLVPILRGLSSPPRDYLAWRVPQHRALRAGDWKIISQGAGGSWELYNLAEDAGETKNLAASHPDRLRDLAGRWNRWAEACGSSR